MKLHELNRDQLIELKQDALAKIMDAMGAGEPSYGEFGDADELIPDALLASLGYGDYDYSHGDFWCTANISESHDGKCPRCGSNLAEPDEYRSWSENGREYIPAECCECGYEFVGVREEFADDADNVYSECKVA